MLPFERESNAAVMTPLKNKLPLLYWSVIVMFSVVFVILVIVQTVYLAPKARQSGIVFPDPSYTPSDDVIHFLVIGDFGRGSEIQKQIGEVMGEYCKTRNGCDFIIGAGDNIYTRYLFLQT